MDLAPYAFMKASREGNLPAVAAFLSEHPTWGIVFTPPTLHAAGWRVAVRHHDPSSTPHDGVPATCTRDPSGVIRRCTHPDHGALIATAAHERPW